MATTKPRSTKQPTAKPATNHRYAVHPGIRMMQDWIASLKEKTGRTVDEWVAHIRGRGPSDEPARRAWLKREHGLGTNSAWWLAARATTPGAGDEDTPEGYLAAAHRYVEAQYDGKKAALRPIYERLLDLGLALGPDARACPCKTMVPLYREHVFANITPTTNTRVDLGLALAKVPDAKIPRRLIDTGGKAKKDRITHRLPIESVDQIDDFVEHWLRTAYDLDAPAPRPTPTRTPRKPAERSTTTTNKTAKRKTSKKSTPAKRTRAR